MNRFIRVTCIVSILCLCCTAKGQQDPAAELRILAIGPGNQPAQLVRADVYLDVWGGGIIFPMVRDDRGATLRIDRTSLCTAWSEGCPAFFNEASRIILRADGYAPVTQTVGFADGGSSFEIHVSFRRPLERSLKVVDDKGAAIPGVKLEGQLFFAVTNHCGVPEGEQLFRSETDRSGRVQIPDVDGDIFVEFSGLKHAILKTPSPISATGLTISPDDFPTTIAIHSLKRQPLQLIFTRNARPATGLKLLGYLAHGGCGAIDGVLAETDTRGRIQIDDFYPEEFESLELLDESGMPVWKGTAPYNPAGGVSRIRLP